MVQIDEKVYGSSKAKVEAIFDQGTFVELSAYTKRHDSQSDFEGVVCGYGSVNGKLAFAFVQDSGRTKGAFSERHAKKITDMYALAIKNGAPVIGVFDSAGAVVYVKGGNYVIGVDNVAQYGEYACNSAVYARDGGKAYISGGTFKVETAQTIAFPYNTRFLLNLKDKAADGSQDDNEIVVTGGTFYQFNPADNIAENPKVNFVADGYQSVETPKGSNVWTVTKE